MARRAEGRRSSGVDREHDASVLGERGFIGKVARHELGEHRLADHFALQGIAHRE